MVGNASEGTVNRAQMTPSEPKIEPERLAERLAALPGIERLREAAAGLPAYLVGGAVRDLLLGRERADLDVAVEGEVAALWHRRRARRRLRDRPGGDPRRDLRPSWRAPRDSSRVARRRPRPPRLHGERDGGAAGWRSGADRSPWRPRGPATRRAAGPAPGLVRGRPHPCPASRAIRGPLRLRARARHGGALPAGRPLDCLARPGGDRAPKAGRGAASAPGVRAARRMGPARA